MKIGSVSPSVPEMDGIYATGGILFEDVPSVEFIYLVFTRTPGGVTVSDSGLCYCVPCLSSTITSLRLLILTASKKVIFTTQTTLVGCMKVNFTNREMGDWNIISKTTTSSTFTFSK